MVWSPQLWGHDPWSRDPYFWQVFWQRQLHVNFKHCEETLPQSSMITSMGEELKRCAAKLSLTSLSFFCWYTCMMYVCHGICWEAILEPFGLVGFCNKDSYGCHCSGGKCWKSWKIRWRKCNAGMHRKCWRTHNSHPTCKSIHVSKPCHENGPKSENDDWKLRTWQWSLWNPLEPQRCVSSWPHSKHFQQVKMVTQNDRKKPNLRYKNHSKYSPMDSHGIIADGYSFDKTNIDKSNPETSGGSYHRPLLDVSTATQNLCKAWSQEP